MNLIIAVVVVVAVDDDDALLTLEEASPPPPPDDKRLYPAYDNADRPTYFRYTPWTVPILFDRQFLALFY